MDKEKKIQEEVRKTMQVFDRLDRVDGNPYLATRLRERMRQKPPARGLTWQWAITAVLLLLNIAALYNWNENRADSSTTLEESIAEEYGWGTDQETAIELYSQNQ